MTWIINLKDTDSGIPKWEVDLKLVLQEIRENIMKKKIALLEEVKSGVKIDSKIIETEAMLPD